MNPTPYELYIELDDLQSLWPEQSASANETVICCGFQAVEICWNLVTHALDDPRETSFRQKRIERYLDVITASMHAVSQMIDEPDEAPFDVIAEPLEGDGGTDYPSP
ncbi:hypothetical protein GTY86_04545, partial [Streptomyces sp. SID5770]|uniref:hypothetical protein n=1 Tax=Streptomyces sp. SID5770 TaxID=2690308 RepID=UPI00136D1861